MTNSLAHLARAARPLTGVLVLLVLGCHHQLPSQTPKPSKAEAAALKAAPALTLGQLAGQKVPLLPATYLIATDSIAGLPVGQPARLGWADSLLGAELAMRGPEVSWILPAELRLVAKRAPGTVNDPDKMGQALLRSPGLKIAPDQFVTNLRPLVALTGARYVMVPASINFARTPVGVEATASFVMLDARSGGILWRSQPVATAATAGAALAALVQHILP